MDVATYEHIRALQEAGDKHQAIQAVIDATAAQVEQSSQTHLSAAAQAWRSLSQEIDTFWAKLKQGASSGPSLQDQIDTLSREREEISSAPMLPFGTSREDVAGRIAEINRQIEALGAKQKAENDAADAAGKAAQQQQAAIDAETRIDKMRDQIMSNAQKRQKELKQLAADRASILGAGGKFSDTDYASMVADINDKYKDPKQPKPKAYTDDAATKFLQQLHDQSAELQSQLSTTDKLTNAQKELAKFNQQVNDWQGKTLTADQKSLLAHQDQIRAQLQTNVELEKEVAHRQDVQKLLERSQQISASMASYQKGQTEQYARQLDAFGMGSDAVKNAQAVKSIYAEYQHLQEQLDKATPKDLIGGDDYQKATANIKAGLDQSLKDYDAYYAALKTKQGDWVNGFTAGVANYLDSAHNMAAQTESAFTNVMKGMEDSLTSFVTTGKFNFSSFATSVIADIARIQARAAISGLLGTAISALGSMFGNTGATITANVQGTGLDGLIGSTGGWGTVPARAAGGPVDGGSAYLIGEKGPELFVPGASGAVVPNHALSSIAGSGGGTSNQFNITLGDSGGGGWSQQDLASLQQVLGGWMDQRMDKRMKGQGGYAWQIRNRSV
ncbi:phage tail tape measure protein [Paraburkholderia sp. JHI2823]|uniref:phage tail tape measure protein n=1 Tax=Paraburkholderia sp. JHI2823 TaxID=3112960 RepID=UPI0031757ECD